MCAACLKYSVRIFVEQIYKIQRLEVSGAVRPLQGWLGVKGFRFPDFITTAQNGGKVVKLTHRPPLPPGNTPGTHFC